jgi:hypothetical protein
MSGSGMLSHLLQQFRFAVSFCLELATGKQILAFNVFGHG